MIPVRWGAGKYASSIKRPCPPLVFIVSHVNRGLSYHTIYSPYFCLPHWDVQMQARNTSLTGPTAGGGTPGFTGCWTRTNWLSWEAQYLSANNTDLLVPLVEWHAIVCTKYSARCVALDVLMLSTRCVCELCVDYPQTVCGFFFSQTRCPQKYGTTICVWCFRDADAGTKHHQF